MAASISFYRLLGLDVPETPEEGHVDAFLPNGVRFMLDSEDVIRSFVPDWTRESGNQVSLALECASPSEVDETYARVVAAGFEGEKEPWDAVGPRGGASRSSCASRPARAFRSVVVLASSTRCVAGAAARAAAPPRSCTVMPSLSLA